MRCERFFRTIFALLVLAGAKASAGDLIEKELHLKESGEVWSKTVCLNDLVEGGWINSRCAVDRAMCCRWNLGTALRKTFTRADVMKELRNVRVFGFALDLKGAARATITQTRRELTEDEIASKYLSAANGKFGDEANQVSIERIKPLGPIYVGLDEESDWDVLPPESLTDSAPIKVVATRDRTRVLGWVQVAARLDAEVYVARRTIRATEALKHELFELKKINVMAPRAAGETVIRKNEFPELARARLTMPPGAPLLASAVERVPLVRLGDSVTLIMRSDSLKISTKGIVQQGHAGVGDMVTVSLPRYNRTFRGRLSEGKFVEVWL